MASLNLNVVVFFLYFENYWFTYDNVAIFGNIIAIPVERIRAFSQCFYGCVVKLVRGMLDIAASE